LLAATHANRIDSARLLIEQDSPSLNAGAEGTLEAEETHTSARLS
jgi:hypothetical protein